MRIKPGAPPKNQKRQRIWETTGRQTVVGKQRITLKFKLDLIGPYGIKKCKLQRDTVQSVAICACLSV